MKIHLDWVGCRLNQSEMESMAAEFHQLGHEIAEHPSESDLVVLNTCNVTAAAGSDSRSLIRNTARSNPTAKIILTGCWSELNPNQAESMDGVFRVFKNAEKRSIPESVLHQKNGGGGPIVRVPLTGDRRRTRAHIKVQDGCDFHCAYCVTTIARGGSQSLPIESVLNRVQGAYDAGTKEVVLCGVALSSYGRDLRPRVGLGDLLEKILNSTQIKRVRLSSLEPWGLEKDLFALWRDRRLCSSLHIPLQSGSDHTLQRMQRPSTTEAYSRVVEAARDQIPDLGLSTDILVGFPGETEQEFERSLDFIQKMNFSGGHVFTYSPRPDTPAAGYPQQIHPQVRKVRSRIVRESLERSRQMFVKNFLNESVEVLWEAGKSMDNGGFLHRGLTRNGIRVHTFSKRNLHNQLTLTRIKGLMQMDLLGESIETTARS